MDLCRLTNINQGRKTNPHSQNRSKNDFFEGQSDLNLLDENVIQKKGGVMRLPLALIALSASGIGSPEILLINPLSIPILTVLDPLSSTALCILRSILHS